MSSIINIFPVSLPPKIGEALAFTATGSLSLPARAGGSARGLNFQGKGAVQIKGTPRLTLSNPAPILNELSAGAFSKPYYAARLKDSLGNEIAFTSASFETPKEAVGSRVSINVAKTDLSLITNAKTYTFEIGRRDTPTGAIVWEPPIILNGQLNSRNFSLGVNANDSLSFGTIEPLTNKLNKFPLENTIFFDPRKTSVNLAEAEKIKYYGTDFEIGTGAAAFNGLNLYTIFAQIKKRIGFNKITTNLPNFEKSRFDLSYNQSYLDAIRGLTGIFSPLIFPGTAAGELVILDKTAAIPDSFVPRSITAGEFTNWQISIPEAPEIDGYDVSFANDNAQATYFTDRTVNNSKEPVGFGSPDYTRIDTETTFREWRSNDARDQILKSEIVKVKKESFVDLATLVSRRTENHSFDSQGRRISSIISNAGRVPDLGNNGVPFFRTIRDELQDISYTSDPRTPQKSLQSRIVTRIRGLVAIDSDNKYFDPDTGEQSAFRQDFLEAHKAGNLTATMTTEYAPLKTITETLQDLGNGQYQTSVSTIDHLRKAETTSISEPKTGDASLSSIAPKQSKTIVLRAGLTPLTRTGLPLEDFNLGELPLFFGIPLVKRLLKRRSEQKQSGTINVAGYSNSVQRGTFFRVLDRNAVSYGRFICTGLRGEIQALGDGCSITMSLDVEEI